MISLLYQTSIVMSIMFAVIVLIRQPVRYLLGANIAYWLWLIPLISFIPLDFLGIFSQTNLIQQSFIKEININSLINTNNSSLSSNYYLIHIWLLGLLTWTSVRIFSWKKFHKLLSNNRIEIDISRTHPQIIEKFATRSYKLYLTSIPSAPLITGLLSVKIYLPKVSFYKLNNSQQLCILRHELSHIKNHDLWLLFLAEVILALFWFNIIFHIAMIFFKQDQEIACDYKVLSKSNAKERYEYGKVLLTSIKNINYPVTMTFFNYHKQRFSMIKKHKRSVTKNVIGLGLFLTLTTFGLLASPISLNNDKLKTQIGITGIKISKQATFKIIGNAKSMNDVSKYMRKLETSIDKGINFKVELKSVITTQDGSIDFVLLQTKI